MKQYTRSAQAVLRGLRVDRKKGLASRQVVSRRAEYGSNQLERHDATSPVIIFFRQFKSFIIWILLFAVVVSILAGEPIDAIVIVVILVFNALFGFLQEYKAERAIDALKRMSALQATVIRGGKTTTVPSEDLVPGDIVLLAEGNKVPADMRIIEAHDCYVTEASLTGESNPVRKAHLTLKKHVPLAERNNMLYAGTALTRGRAQAVVVATGMRTEIGKIATILSTQEREMTPLQQKLQRLGRWIGSVTLLVCCAVFGVGIFRDRSISLLLSGDLVAFLVAAKTWLLTAVSLAVAAVPEGLPAIVTITLALGVRQMVKRNALVRRLPSVETLGSTTVICTDKTGTITKNTMTVRAWYTPDTSGMLSNLRDVPDLLFAIGALCTDAKKNDDGSYSGDPTETALLASAEHKGLSLHQLASVHKRIDERSFDSRRKMMTTVHRTKEGRVAYTKGAPEAVLACCTRVRVGGGTRRLTAAMRSRILKQNETYASRALRVLAFAYHPQGRIEEDLVFVGLQAMMDPPHEEVKDAVRTCHDAGIRVIMITGDNGITARAIAHEVGIEGDEMSGHDFAVLSHDQQKRALRRVNIFSRVEPEHKMRIVDLLQKSGEVVAMTGDGVNDAPALKEADIGIAMGVTGTDVAKEASEMVLQDDNFASIVRAIEEGRGIFDNISTFVNYLLSTNFAEVLVIFIAILFGLPLPLTAIMLLWINLVTDGFPALALGVDPKAAGVMQRKPRALSDGILSRREILHMSYFTFLETAAILGVFLWAMNHYALTVHVQTLAMTTLVFMEYVWIYTIRNAKGLSLWSNPFLVLALGASFLSHLLIVYSPLRHAFGTAPLHIIDWFFVIGSSALVYIFYRSINIVEQVFFPNDASV